MLEDSQPQEYKPGIQRFLAVTAKIRVILQMAALQPDPKLWCWKRSSLKSTCLSEKRGCSCSYAAFSLQWFSERSEGYLNPWSWEALLQPEMLWADTWQWWVQCKKQRECPAVVTERGERWDIWALELSPIGGDWNINLLPSSIQWSHT